MRRLDRRRFLASLGLSSMFLPLLGSRESRGAVLEKPKRLIIVAVPNGVKEAVYWPSGGRYDFTIPVDADVPAEHAFSPLQPLIPHQKDIIFCGGIAIQNGRDTNGGSLGGHGSLPFVLTGARGVPGPEISDGLFWSAANASVDRFIGKELAKRHGLGLDSLVLKPIKPFRGNDGYLSFDGPPIGDTPNVPTPLVDPYAIFEQLFGGGDIEPDTLARLRARRKSVLDLVGKELEGYAQNLGTEDRERVQKHLEAIRTLEKQVATSTSGCSKPTLVTDPNTDYLNDNGNQYIDVIVRDQIDLTVAAMACDMTRVASMIWADQGNVRWVFHWLGEEFTKPGTDFANNGENQGLRNHHEIAHRDGEPEYQPLMNRGCQWFLEQFAYLIQKLKDTPDPDGSSMFESSVLLFANLQRTGGGHHTDNLPWILAGSCGGYFKTGQFIPWPSGSDRDSAPQNGILTALCNALDVPRDFYGSADYGGEFSMLRG